MSIAARIVEVAEQEVGVTEVPMGSNTGGRVREYQASTSLGGTGWPWCAAFVEWCWEKAGLDDHPANPSTFWMCKNAAARGELSDRPKVGGAIIWCGTHTGIVVAVGSGIVHTIEGNSGDQVARRVRSISGAKFVNPSGLDDLPAAPARYWLEDLGAKVKVYGPWKFRAWAERVLAKMPEADRRRARIVEPGAGGYAIAIGRRTYGPWSSQKVRDDKRKILEARLGRTLRPYRTGGSSEADGEAEDIGKTT